MLQKSKHLELTLAAVAVIATSIPLGLWVMKFGTPNLSDQNKEWEEFGTFVGGVLSPLLAFAGYIGLLFTIRQQREGAWKQQEDKDSKHYFDHAVSCLERAFGAISAAGQSRQPVRDKLAWLTCARLLLSAQAAAELIAKDATGLRTLYDGEVEHWRHKFYEFFQPTSPESFGNDFLYFLQDDSTPPMSIDERSTRVVYEFISWPTGKTDAIDHIARYADNEIDAMKAGKLGLQSALRHRRSVIEGRGDRFL